MEPYELPIFAFGSNGSGQLAIGHTQDTDEPTRCILAVPDTGEEPQRLKVIKVVAGGTHTLLLTSSGRVLIAGALIGAPDLGDAQLGSCSHTFRHLQGGVQDCSATWTATIILTTDGSVHTYGQGDKGELGQGPNVVVQLKASPSIVLPMMSALQGARVVSLASGLQHTVAVLSTGEVVGWGNGRKGQLGEPHGIVWKPRKIEGLDFKVVRAICGREFTYLAGEPEGGRHSILGSDKWRIKSSAPDRITAWKEIGSNWSSIFVLLNSGRILSWGRDDHGQLAPKGLPSIDKMAVGSEHTLAVAEDGRVLAWGWGEHGNCGSKLDTRKEDDIGRNYNVVSCLSDEGVRGIGAGCATSWIWR